MSEVMNAKTGPRDFRRFLLTGVSTLALLSAVHARDARASSDDGNQPPVWIELGGTFERVNASQTPFMPPFASVAQPSFETISSAGLQKPPGYSFGAEAAIMFQPEGTNWVISASARYGRAINDKKVYQHPPFPTTYAIVYSFFGTTTRNTQSHAILDFRAGKDIGLGMAGSSVLSLGVRFAQFSARSNVILSANPTGVFHQSGFYGHRSFSGTAYSARSFHGIGPSISWDGAVPLAGNISSGQIAFDWGANAALLFGRQKAAVMHQTGEVVLFAYKNYFPYQTAHAHVRARSVTVPNVGGLVGASYRRNNFEVKLGYRADFFFGAMDGGFDAARRTDRGFYGPVATIGIGIGG